MPALLLPGALHGGPGGLCEAAGEVPGVPGRAPDPLQRDPGLPHKLHAHQDLLGQLVDRVVAGEANLPVVLLAARVIVADPVHHLEEDVLAVHQLVVIPLGPVVHVLIHEVRV